MLQENIESQRIFLSSQIAFRDYHREIALILEYLNTSKIVTISWVRYSGKTALISNFIKKTWRGEDYFYFNSELDALWQIMEKQALITLMDAHIRIHWTPKIIILQNTNNIVWIKHFIHSLFKANKYKIILIGNSIKVQWVNDIELFPMRITKESFSEKLYWGLPLVRIAWNAHYKESLLRSFRNDLITKEILESYNIKNLTLFHRVIAYISLITEYHSLRELHRNASLYGIEISLLTFTDYINAAVTTKLLRKSHRYDVKHDNLISSQVQYFFWDVWLRYTLSEERVDYRENILMLELLSRGFDVSAWINGTFTFEVYATSNKTTIAIAFEQSRDKKSIRKTARKLAKLPENISKYVLIDTPISELWMRKSVEQWVEILELETLLFQRFSK